MKKPILLIILIIAVVVYPAFSQRIFKDVAQGTDNARVFSSGSFISGDTLFFVASNINTWGYNFKYYQTNGTPAATKKLRYKPEIEHHNFGQGSLFYKFNNTIYGLNHGILFKIKGDSLQHIKGIGTNFLMNFFELNNELHFLICNWSENKFQFWKISILNEEPILYHYIDVPDSFSTQDGFYLNNKYYHGLATPSGNYLISTDGTASGTYLIQNKNFGLYNYQKIGNKIYYPRENTGPNWYRLKLWRTQADSASTIKVLKAIDADTNYSVYNLFKFNNDLYFTSSCNNQYRISKLDTTTLDVSHISNSLNGVNETIVKNNKIHYYTWQYNTLNFYENSGSIASENLLFTIPDQGSSQIKFFIGNTNYYVSQQVQSANGFEDEVTYWVYDGLILKKINDLKPALATGLFMNAVGVVGNIFYFSASDGQHGYELWRTDGTAAGTHILKDINENPASSLAKPLFSVGNYLYFMADDISHGNELWRTDGTNTSLYADLNSSIQNNSHVASSDFRCSVIYGSSYIADLNFKFYQFTPDGNMKSLDFLPIYYLSIPHEYKNLLYFMGNDGNLWSTDCTIAGTKKAVHLDSTGYGTGFSGISDLIKVDSLLYFTSNNGSILWRTNGKKNGTVKLFSFATGLTGSVYPNYLIPYASDRIFYFQRLSDYSTSNYELWASDGTIAGTRKLPADNLFRVMGTLNNRIYFIANSSFDLWQSDGTLAGTQQFDERFFSGAMRLRDKLYLLRPEGYNLEYFEIDKNNTIQYLNMVEAPTNLHNTSFSDFYKLDERFILNIIKDTDTREDHFYITDGNKENIKKAFVLKKSNPIVGDYEFILHKNKFYFSATDTLKGQELWIWDFECPDGYTIRDAITKDSTIIYGKNIWGQSSISNNKTVTYDAKNGITLQPGFEAPKGAVFKTKLVGCANNTSNTIEDNNLNTNEPLVKINTATTYPQLMDFLYYFPNKALKEIYERAQQNKSLPISWEIVTEKDIYRLDLKIGFNTIKGFLPKMK
ncbi:3-coathanger stack domain-containing protein [Emticicia agri]|uniref:DUF5050 domain-containing protein n=1 Tax=Emticicia agri TaxID=2492393 RepID=A0A4Q5LZG3_9BACT|nr:3-coathanger stack domain-containing protein [Emticicia agri]RYU95085.1 hypothetical protein EWM59_13625 [Emticicia agri]